MGMIRNAKKALFDIVLCFLFTVYDKQLLATHLGRPLAACRGRDYGCPLQPAVSFYIKFCKENESCVFFRLFSQFPSTKAQRPPPCPPGLRPIPQVQTSVRILSPSHQSSNPTSRRTKKTPQMTRRKRRKKARRRRMTRRSLRMPRGHLMPWTTYSAIRPSPSSPWSSSSRPL